MRSVPCYSQQSLGSIISILLLCWSWKNGRPEIEELGRHACLQHILGGMIWAWLLCYNATDGWYFASILTTACGVVAVLEMYNTQHQETVLAVVFWHSAHLRFALAFSIYHVYHYVQVARYALC